MRVLLPKYPRERLFTGHLFSDFDHSDVLTDLNKKTFPRDTDGFSKLVQAAVLDESQVYLLKVAFSSFLIYIYIYILVLKL